MKNPFLLDVLGEAQARVRLIVVKAMLLSALLLCLMAFTQKYLPAVVSASILSHADSDSLWVLEWLAAGVAEQQVGFLKWSFWSGYLLLVTLLVTIYASGLAMVAAGRWFVFPREEWAFEYLAHIATARPQVLRVLYGALFLLALLAAAWVWWVWLSEATAPEPIVAYRAIGSMMVAFVVLAVYAVQRRAGVFRFLATRASSQLSRVRVVLASSISLFSLLAFATIWLLIIDQYPLAALGLRLEAEGDAAQHLLGEARTKLLISGVDAQRTQAIIQSLARGQVSAFESVRDVPDLGFALTREARSLVLITANLGFVFHVLLPLLTAEVRRAWAHIGAVVAVAFFVSRGVSWYGVRAGMDQDSFAWLAFALLAAFVVVELLERTLRHFLQRGAACNRCETFVSSHQAYCGKCGEPRMPALVLVRSTRSDRVHRHVCPFVVRIASKHLMPVAEDEPSLMDGRLKRCSYCLQSG